MSWPDLAPTAPRTAATANRAGMRRASAFVTWDTRAAVVATVSVVCRWWLDTALVCYTGCCWSRLGLERSRWHRGNSLFCCAVTSISSQRLLHKMTNSKSVLITRLHVRYTSRLRQETRYLASILTDKSTKWRSVTSSFCKFSLSSLKTTSNNVHSSFENVCKIISR